MTSALIKRGVLAIAIAAVCAFIMGAVYYGLIVLLYFVRSPAMAYFFPDSGRFAVAYYFMYLLFAAVACLLGSFFTRQKGLKGQPKKTKILYFLAAAAITFAVIVLVFLLALEFLKNNVILFGV